MPAHTEWAKIGARVRLTELNSERAAILKSFPDLRQGRGAGAGRRRRRAVSAAARAKMRAGMRKYWARRKAEAKALEAKGK